MKRRQALKIIGFAALLAGGGAVAQEQGDGQPSPGEQREDREARRQEMRERWESMSEEEREAARAEMRERRDSRREEMRERWENMSEEEREAMREKRRAAGGKRGPGGRRPPDGGAGRTP